MDLVEQAQDKPFDDLPSRKAQPPKRKPRNGLDNEPFKRKRFTAEQQERRAQNARKYVGPKSGGQETHTSIESDKILITAQDKPSRRLGRPPYPEAVCREELEADAAAAEMHYEVERRNGELFSCACGKTYCARGSLSAHIRIQVFGSTFFCPKCHKGKKASQG